MLFCVYVYENTSMGGRYKLVTHLNKWVIDVMPWVEELKYHIKGNNGKSGMVS